VGTKHLNKQIILTLKSRLNNTQHVSFLFAKMHAHFLAVNADFSFSL
jgi:hypothetical protein